MDSDVLHVLDLATLRDWGGAKAALQTLDGPVASRMFILVSELDHHEVRRRNADTHLRHEIGNALSIVRANLEGIIDEVLPATPERLKGMSEALAEASVLLDDLRAEPEYDRPLPEDVEQLDLYFLVARQYAMVEDLADSKSVSFINACSGSIVTDEERSTLLVRNVIVGSIRFTPPSGTVELRNGGEPGEVDVTISGLRENTIAPRALLRGEEIGGVEVSGETLTFTLSLPLAAG